MVGVDNSPEMVANAQTLSDSIRWIEADIAQWQPDAAPDLIYSNATLQWLDGHDALIPRLLDLLAPGGCLAVQMPQSWPLPSHRLMRETLAHGGPDGTPIGPPSLREALGHVWVADAAHYYDVLSAISQSIDIWETEYLQMLDGEDPVLRLGQRHRIASSAERSHWRRPRHIPGDLHRATPRGLSHAPQRPNPLPIPAALYRRGSKPIPDAVVIPIVHACARSDGARVLP